MTDDVLHAVRVLYSPGQVIEVRAITDEGMASGYFNDPEHLAERVDTLDGLSGMQGIYVTLNEVNPALLSRRANRIKTRLSKKDATTADTDILRAGTGSRSMWTRSGRQESPLPMRSTRPHWIAPPG